MDVYQLQSRVRSDFFRNSKLDQVGHLWKVIALEGTLSNARLKEACASIYSHTYIRMSHVCYGIGFECLSSGRHAQGE